MRFPDFKILNPFGILFLLGAGAQAADLQSLVSRSPFAPVPGLAETKAETPETLEFRGLVVDERGTTYSLFDTAAKRSYWVREGGKGSIRFKAFDAEECVLEVEQNGNALTLPLKSATIATAAAPVAVAAASPGRREGRTVVRVISRPAAGDEKRMERIAEEVRRRRTARQAAAEARTSARPAVPPATPGF